MHRHYETLASFPNCSMHLLSYSYIFDTGDNLIFFYRIWFNFLPIIIKDHTRQISSKSVNQNIESPKMGDSPIRGENGENIKIFEFGYFLTYQWSFITNFTNIGQ